MRRLSLTVAIVFLVAVPTSLLGSGCSGNACAVITRADSGGCIIFKNNGKRAVHIAVGIISKNVGAGGTFKLVNLGGTCLKLFPGDVSASYIQ